MSASCLYIAGLLLIGRTRWTPLAVPTIRSIDSITIPKNTPAICVQVCSLSCAGTPSLQRMKDTFGFPALAFQTFVCCESAVWCSAVTQVQKRPCALVAISNDYCSLHACPCSCSTARSTSPFPWLSPTRLFSKMTCPAHAFFIAWATASNDLSWSLFKITFRYPKRSKSFNTTVVGHGCPTPCSGTECTHLHLHFKRLSHTTTTCISGSRTRNLLRGMVFDAVGCDFPRPLTHAEHQSLYGRCNTSCATIIARVGWIGAVHAHLSVVSSAPSSSGDCRPSPELPGRPSPELTGRPSWSWPTDVPAAQNCACSGSVLSRCTHHYFH